MKIYKICDNVIERIEFKVGRDQYALVYKIKSSGASKTIIMNQREILILDQAIQTEILKERK